MIKRVLLIDDDTDEHDVFIEALKLYNKNIVCIAATGWVESSPLLHSFSPDIIFLDYNMPIINGTETLKLIRQIKNLKDAKVYMYSASDNPKYINEALKLEAIRWIVKPNSLEGYTRIFQQVFAA
ncbi:MAG TPA: response regulator [Chitinophagaceae bacterium]|jgi:CheY-like chemotaxis protein